VNTDVGEQCQAAALQRAQLGFPSLPIAAGTKGPWLKQWPERRITDETEIQTLWEERPDSWLGCPCGAQHGRVVIDVDVKGKANGLDALTRLEKELGPLPTNTPRTRTPSGGLHIHVRYPEGTQIPSQQLFNCIDVQSDGKQVLIPPSPGYQWIVSEDTTLKEMSSAWLEYLRDKRPQRGERNERLTKHCGHLAREYRDYQQYLARALAFGHDCDPPLDDRETRRTAESIWKRERDKRGVDATGISDRKLIESVPPPTLGEFLAFDFPPQEQVLGPYNTQTINLIAARAGVGKTQLAHAMAAALVREDGRLMRWQSPKPRRVLLVDGELPGRQLQDRFLRYRLTPEEQARIAIVSAISWATRLDQGHVNLVHEFWRQALDIWSEGADVLILDNVMSLVAVPGVSVSSDEFWKPMLDILLPHRAANRCAIILDHANSQGEIFGTKTKEWHADSVAMLEPAGVIHGGESKAHFSGAGESRKNGQSDPLRFTLRFSKYRGERSPQTLPFEAEMTEDRHGYCVWYAHESDRSIALEAKELADSGVPQRDIATELGISQARVSRLLRRMRNGEF
jgi:hypothetical protein